MYERAKLEALRERNVRIAAKANKLAEKTGKENWRQMRDEAQARVDVYDKLLRFAAGGHDMPTRADYNLVDEEVSKYQA